MLLPAFVAAEGEQGDRPRTLVLRQLEEGRLSYALLRADGPRLGDADTVAGADVDTGLDETVADLASGRGGDAATDLLPYGVRFVLLGRPVDPALADAIDAVPGLVRVSAPDRSALWKVRYPSGRVRVVSGPADTTGTVLPSGAVGVRTDIPAASAPRLLTIADQHHDRWQAILDEQRLEPQEYDGWAQAFALPTDGGLLVVRYDDGNRQLLLWLQLAAVIVALVLALPSVRAIDEADEHAVAEPPPPAAARPGRPRRPCGGGAMRPTAPTRSFLAVTALLALGAGISTLVGPPSAVVAQAPGRAPVPVVRGVAVCPEPFQAAGAQTQVGMAAPGLDGAPPSTGQAQLLRLSRKGAPVVSLAPPDQQAAAAAPARSPALVGEATDELAPGFAAMETTRTPSGDLRGLSGTSCVAAGTDFWFVGSGAEVGQRGRLYLTNPESAPAQVDVTLYGPAGEIDAPSGRGVSVAARGQEVILLDALAPAIPRFGVHVQVRQGRIAAALRDQQIRGLDPLGVDWVPPAAAPSRRVVLAGVPAGSGERHLQVLAPGTADAIVRVRLLAADGAFVPAGLDVVEIPAGTVARRRPRDACPGRGGRGGAHRRRADHCRPAGAGRNGTRAAGARLRGSEQPADAGPAGSARARGGRRGCGRTAPACRVARHGDRAGGADAARDGHAPDGERARGHPDRRQPARHQCSAGVCRHGHPAVRLGAGVRHAIVVRDRQPGPDADAVDAAPGPLPRRGAPGLGRPVHRACAAGPDGSSRPLAARLRAQLQPSWCG